MDIFFIILGLVFIVCGISWHIATKLSQHKYSNGEPKNKTLKAIVPICILIGIILFISGNSFTIVPTGYVGIPYTVGTMERRIISPGMAWHTPFFTRIDIESTQIRDENYVDGENEHVWGECKDNTPIMFSKIRISFQIAPENLPWLKENVPDLSVLCSQITVQSAIEAVSTELTAKEVVNPNIRKPLLAEKLQILTDAKYGKGRVNVLRAIVGSTEYEASYISAINEKNKRDQEAQTAAITNQQNIDRETAEAEARKIKAEADQTVEEINAKTRATVKKTDADAQAEATRINAEAQADATRLAALAKADSIRAEGEATAITNARLAESINTGWPYNLGFLLGVGSEVGGITINIGRK